MSHSYTFHPTLTARHDLLLFLFFFFNDTATTEIYTLSLHDALPISLPPPTAGSPPWWPGAPEPPPAPPRPRESCRDRKSTRLNSSHGYISYAVFCLKKKKKKEREPRAYARPTVERCTAPAMADSIRE